VGDRGYDAEAIRLGLRVRQIVPLLAKRNTERGSGLGRWRWVVERTFASLNQFRRLRVRYEKRRHPRGIAVPRMCSDLLALPRCRLQDYQKPSPRMAGPPFSMAGSRECGTRDKIPLVRVALV